MAGEDREERPADDFPVVGIGASAGGLEAIEALIKCLAPDNMAYIILQHLPGGQESLLVEILRRSTAMKVETLRDGERVQPSTIYVTPPGTELEIKGRVFHTHPPKQPLSHLPIDLFFRSLAADVGNLAIGVILSGAGSDGTLGLRAIKEEGGITFVQDPRTAGQSSMPQSAIDANCCDFALDPSQIGDELMRISTHPYVARKRPPKLFNPDILKTLFEQLFHAFGVDFSAYKLATVERRIQRRMALQKVEKLDDYLHFIESKSDELNLLYNDMLIGVTEFFRDEAPFEALKRVVFPRLLEGRSTDSPIRVWIPGCSTGEEAYSMAICFLEYLDQVAPGYKVQIFATDIDDQSLARGRRGLYPRNIELDVSHERLQRFFILQERGYEVSRQLRDLVVFARHNLGKDPPFSRLDLISCRNLLIYLQPPLQRKVLRVFHYALNPDGYLLLGTSESVGDGSDLFSVLDGKLKIYSKKNIASSGVFDFALTRLEGGEVPPQAAGANLERRPPVSIQQMADRKVLEKFGPPGLLVDERMEVVQFRGQAGPFLGPSPGAATLNLMKLIRPELLVALRMTLERVSADGLPHTSEPVRVSLDGEAIEVLVDVMPISEAGAPKKAFLILFREVQRPVAVVEGAKEDAARDPHLQDLERELLVTKEYLQTTVEQLETANEEFQSSNEELQSSNEELQSTNEELETSKEELQATNEELATVNQELQHRIVQLNVSNDDLQNVLDNVTTPLLIIDLDLRIRRFSTAAAALFSLIPTDVGRPVAYLASALNAPQIGPAVSETIQTLRPRELRIRSGDGQRFLARLLPYRTQEHAIRGVLIELLKAPPGRKLGEPPEINELVSKLLSALPHAVMLLDDHVRISWANRAFFEAFGLGPEILGQALDEVWPGLNQHAELANALEITASDGKPFESIQVTDPFGKVGAGPTRFSARWIAPDGDRPSLTLVEIGS